MNRSSSLATRSRTSRTVTLVAALGAIAGMSACTGSSDTATAPVTVTATDQGSAAGSAAADTASTGSAATGDVSVPQPASQSASATGPAAEPLPVIGTRKGAKDGNGNGMEVSLNSVTVNADLMTVTFSARSDSAESWMLGNYFYAGNPDEGKLDKTLEAGAGIVDGVYVLDAAAKKRYLPARDKDGHCVCSSLGAQVIGAGSDVVLEAVFAAPPDSTTTVDVSIPNVGTFAKVPVTRA